MTRAELLRLIESTNRAIREYKDQGLDRSPNEQAATENAKIQRASTTLIKESWSLGAAGRVCSRCGGSGREP
jgi:hypothetical protein